MHRGRERAVVHVRLEQNRLRLRVHVAERTERAHVVPLGVGRVPRPLVQDDDDSLVDAGSPRRASESGSSEGDGPSARPEPRGGAPRSRLSTPRGSPPRRRRSGRRRWRRRTRARAKTAERCRRRRPWGPRRMFRLERRRERRHQPPPRFSARARRKKTPGPRRPGPRLLSFASCATLSLGLRHSDSGKSDGDDAAVDRAVHVRAPDDQNLRADRVGGDPPLPRREPRRAHRALVQRPALHARGDGRGVRCSAKGANFARAPDRRKRPAGHPPSSCVASRRRRRGAARVVSLQAIVSRGEGATTSARSGVWAACSAANSRQERASMASSLALGVPAVVREQDDALVRQRPLVELRRDPDGAVVSVVRALPGSALTCVCLWCSFANTKKRFAGSWHIARRRS